MLFNSIDFVVFLPIVFSIFWVLKKNLKLQNFSLMVASYIFYGWWDWRFLSLILISSFSDYTIGLLLSYTSRRKLRKLLLLISIIINLGILGFFKYFNFFIDSFISGFSIIGYDFAHTSLDIVLPVGISFYTFQTLSYTIDIYRGKISPTKDLIGFFAFVSFFPQLVAGPIERASNLLHQFSRKKEFDYSSSIDGVRQMIWGFYKKIVIADNCAPIVETIFQNSSTYSGSVLLLGAFFFAFQIYCDFSGYSDIAIGVSRLFGFKLMQNFAFPYFSRDIAEFWRRWHISLSSWFRDYVYIPLGGSKVNLGNKVRNIFIIFILSGFWHGANWTFIAWGTINAIYFLPLMLLGRNRNNLDVVAKNRFLPSIIELFQMLCTFCLTMIAWVFFRASNINDAIGYLSIIFSASLFSWPEYAPLIPFLLIILTVIVEWFQRDKTHALELSRIKPSIRKVIYCSVFLLFFFFGSFSRESFIYFQF